MQVIDKIKNDLLKLSNKKKAEVLKYFFKTGKGQYAEADIFIGVTVPEQRKIAKKFSVEISENEIEELLSSEIHEHRMTALFLLILKYEKYKNEKEKQKIVDIYLRNVCFINNWDLVDLSSPKILGDFLYNFNNDRTILKKLAETRNETFHDIWKNRIAIVSTYYFIKNNDFTDTLEIADILLNHKHDLIHKATGWMLREVGKRNFTLLNEYLLKNHKNMPRTALRYAIEKFSPELKKQFLSGNFIN